MWDSLYLKANVCNFRKSVDSRNFLNFFIFYPDNLYSTLISKITLKLYIFSGIRQSLKNTKSGLFLVWNWRKLSIFFALVHKNEIISPKEFKSQNRHTLYFKIQQWTFNKPFKCDCARRKKKHSFSTFQKWQIWPNLTIVKTQLVHGISIWNKIGNEAYPLLFFLFKIIYFWRHSKRAPSRDKIWRVFWHQEGACNKKVSTLGILIIYSKHKFLRHLNPSQSCNGFRLSFGVSGRFKMIPFNWFLR